MATQNNTQNAAATESKEAKAKDVLNDMDSRRVLDTPEDAIAYLAACMDPETGFADFGNYPVAAAGVSQDEEGNLVFDPEIYTDDMQVMVSVLTQRGDGPNSSTVKAIVIAPIPSLDTILANDEARDWLTKIIQKEMNHVAVRQLRKAENVEDVIDSMPTTLEGYTTSSREASGILAAYEELWRPIKNTMAKLSRSWKLANLSKKELRRGLESKQYASDTYPTLEETKQGSLFVFALNGMIQQAKKAGLDPTIFERWLANRDERVIDVATEDEDETFSLDDLTSALNAKDESSEATEEATEETAEEPAAE